jgi:hypothetical protein
MLHGRSPDASKMITFGIQWLGTLHVTKLSADYLDSKPSFMGRNSGCDTWGRTHSSTGQMPFIFHTSTVALVLV